MAEIFFEDLTKEAQTRLIEDEIGRTMQARYAVRTIHIEKDTYGYDPDPEKQTLEQHIHAKVMKCDSQDRHSYLWLLVWNCFDHEFNTIMKEEQEDQSYKEPLTLRAINVGYHLEDMPEGTDAFIYISVETPQNRFGVKIGVAVAENISEQDKYELAKKFMGKVVFQMMTLDGRYKNGCNIEAAVKAIGERMPDIVQAISKREDYNYNSKED